MAAFYENSGGLADSDCILIFKEIQADRDTRKFTHGQKKLIYQAEH